MRFPFKVSYYVIAKKKIFGERLNLLLGFVTFLNNYISLGIVKRESY